MELQKRLMRKITHIYDEMQETFWKERIVHNARFPQNTYFVIRRRSNNLGLFSYICTSLGYIAYAERNNYIPIIDMKNYKTPFLRSGDYKRKNAWEYWFEQPTKNTLENIQKQKNRIILSSGECPSMWPDKKMCTDNTERAFWIDLYQKYVKFNSQTQEYVDAQKKILFPSSAKILGISIRGTDYTALKPFAHPIQADCATILPKITEIMESGHYDYAYLATEDESVVKIMKEALKNKLITDTAERIQYDKTKGFITEQIRSEVEGLDYLTSIYLLSQCSGYISSGACGKTYGTLLMRGKKDFENEYIFDLGCYQ